MSDDKIERAAPRLPKFQRFQRFHRALRWVIGLLSVGLGLWVLNAAFVRWTRIEPPAEAGKILKGMAKPPMESRGARTYLGQSWAGRERGLWEYHLGGDPVTIGYAHARLGTHLMIETEEYMFGEFRHYVPSQAARFLIRTGVLFQYRNLLNHVSMPHQLELAGVAAGQPDLHGDFMPIFHRIMFYHALHDITQTLEHSPLLGCTGFAASGSATTDAALIIGRNFDFEGPPLFDREKAVLFFRPTGKLAFASVAWTGMTGAVTGINAAGVYASVNALRSTDKSKGGVPVELLLREVLETAHTLDEAIELVKRSPVLVPDLYLLGDGKSGESAVVERTPLRSAVRRSRDVLAVANHAISPEFQADPENERLKSYLTSGARMGRIEELLAQNRGKIDAGMAVEMLRDKRGVGGKVLGLGNRNAIDALIATHSVVVDATHMILWVGLGPHALGEYVAFDLRHELLDEPRRAAPDFLADPTLKTNEYRDFVLAGKELEVSQILEKRGEKDRAIEEAARAVELAPLLPEARKRLADLLYKRASGEDRAAARKHYETFLNLSPPYRREIEEVQALLAK